MDSTQNYANATDHNLVILKGPADWFPWLEQLKRTAKVIDFWEYIDPIDPPAGRPRPNKPNHPNTIDLNEPEGEERTAIQVANF